MAVILIVEDDMLIGELAAMMLQDCGYTTISASDVNEAIEQVRSDRPIDVLFTDIYLKSQVFGGCELAQAAIKVRPNLHVLYTSGNTITNTLRSLLVDGGIFLRKPYMAVQLQDSISRMLAA